jgi:hypothetical protein
VRASKSFRIPEPPSPQLPELEPELPISTNGNGNGTPQIRPLTREVDGRLEPIVVGDDDETVSRFEIPTFLRRQMD